MRIEISGAIDQQGGGLFPANPNSPSRGRSVRPAVSELDRANVKMDVGYGCIAAQRGMVLIGQSDVRGAGRAQDVSNDRQRGLLLCSTHSHHADDARFEYKLAHGVPSTRGVKPIRPPHRRTDTFAQQRVFSL
jgi:hypothetical protein